MTFHRRLILSRHSRLFVQRVALKKVYSIPSFLPNESRVKLNLQPEVEGLI